MPHYLFSAFFISCFVLTKQFTYYPHEMGRKKGNNSTAFKSGACNATFSHVAIISRD